MSQGETTRTFPVQDYDLTATLTSGQVFRWRQENGCWVGVIGRNWVRLKANDTSVTVEVLQPVCDWNWLHDFLQFGVNLQSVLSTFPSDAPMRAAVGACRGLRLLRQDPWECLASFILSSTKQILQIQQIVSLLCERYGEPLIASTGTAPARAFPTPYRIAELDEHSLRACKMGFRAPYLLKTASAIARGEVDLASLSQLPVESARAELMKLPGVGRKIADCVLLFAYGFQTAFPVDVWVMKALRELYFPGKRVRERELHEFAANHFGPWAGYAQQYLFHYMRTRGKLEPPERRIHSA